ncbi:hypothetical protein [Roseomonas xinghualingensis]|uniref:hypothetical protein n=1 Tax=Roseomonas xinghualingensis TaxID=2986475 RepID=UPI0021F133DC|nr:hypothetical protein [Roseomonas sp. SXEYE001]MCV4208016.1 hypothetical protein [Roseomonas sp. SXEYE001]
MRLLIPIVALAALIAFQRPDWLQGLEGGARHAATRLGEFGTQLGIGPDLRSTATRAPEREPDRATALRVVRRVAEAQEDAVGVDEPGPTARDQVRELLRSAAAAMAGSEAMGELRLMREARARVVDLRERVALGRIAGGDVSELEVQLSQAGAEARRLTDAFVEKLAGLGVPVSREAAENLAVSVNGDDVVALLAAYSNVEKLEAELRGSVSQAQDNEAVLRRYYGIHATLLAVLETVQGEVVSRIDNVYLPRLEAIGREVRELRQDAQARLRPMRDAGLKASLEANLRTQELTLKATDLYRRYLQDQRTSLTQALDRTRAARGVADNTARTAALAFDMATMMRNSDRDFSAVMGVRPPVILPFEGDALRREFEGLSRRLGDQPAS